MFENIVGKKLSASEGSQRPAIQIVNVNVNYGSFKALKDFSLTVGEGELLSVLGPSGSGKSTLLNLIAGSTLPDKGTIRFQGQDVTLLPSHKRRVGMVFQRYTLFPNRTVAENVAFPLEVRKEPRETRNKLVAEALEMVGLSDKADRYPSQISGGQAQRAALARALVFKPAILLMDEPLAALDRALRKNLQFEIRSLQQRLRIPMLYVTHDQEEAMSLSDRIVIVKDGEISAEGSPRKLYQNPVTKWCAEFLGDANCLVTPGLVRPGVARLSDGTEVPISADGNPSGGSHILVRPEDIKVSHAKSEGEAFLNATVKWVEYLGSFQRVRLSGLGTEITAQLPARTEDFHAGDNVYVGWTGSNAIMVRDK